MSALIGKSGAEVKGGCHHKIVTKQNIWAQCKGKENPIEIVISGFFGCIPVFVWSDFSARVLILVLTWKSSFGILHFLNTT
jgi:hypothetical protein